MAVAIACRANVVHLVDGSALHAAGLGLFASKLQDISHHMHQFTKLLTVIQRTLCESAGKPVQPTYCSSPAELTVMGSSIVPVMSSAVTPQWPSFPFHAYFLLRLFPRLQHTETAGVQGLHVEDVNTLHLSEDFKTLKTGRLLDIRGNGTGLRTRREEIVVALDLYSKAHVSNWLDALLPRPDVARQRGKRVCGPNIRSIVLYPSRMLGMLALEAASFFSLASPVVESIGYIVRWLSSRPTAHKGGGESATGNGGGGHTACRCDGRTLEEHGEGNWGGVERGSVGARASCRELTFHHQTSLGLVLVLM